MIYYLFEYTTPVKRAKSSFITEKISKHLDSGAAVLRSTADMEIRRVAHPVDALDPDKAFSLLAAYIPTIVTPGGGVAGGGGTSFEGCSGTGNTE
jgi:hypothetical protein